MSLTALQRTEAILRSMFSAQGWVLTNLFHRKNHTFSKLVSRVSKKFTTLRLSAIVVMKSRCKSSKRAESYSNSSTIDGFDPSGRNILARAAPKPEKLQPEWGVPKNRTPWVCSAIFSNNRFRLACRSAWHCQQGFSQRQGFKKAVRPGPLQT
jgi:hypothetical protein